MKINTPLSGNEQHLTESSEIISTTDLKGIIDTANEDFMKISGFETDEIIGVLAHEIGHYKKKHIIMELKKIPIESVFVKLPIT